MQIPQNKKDFLQSDEPLTLFCFVDLAGTSSTYVLAHPSKELETQQAGIKENPEHIYLYIRNQASRDYVGVYGSNLGQAKRVSVTI